MNPLPHIPPPIESSPTSSYDTPPPVAPSFSPRTPIETPLTKGTLRILEEIEFQTKEIELQAKEIIKNVIGKREVEESDQNESN